MCFKLYHQQRPDKILYSYPMAHQDRQAELFRDIFENPLIYNAILACLSPAEVIRVRRTSRLIHDAVTNFQNLAYNINRHLERFVKDPVALRRLQEKTKFLISGSSALQFLDRAFYPSTNLDIFAYPQTVRCIGEHLIEAEGYVFVPSGDQAKDFKALEILGSGWDLIRGWGAPSFERRAGNGTIDSLQFKHPMKGVKIQILSCRISPLDCVFYFNSTCAMNVITPYAAYALYASATFDMRKAMKLCPDFRRRTEAETVSERYIQRGWTHISPTTDEEIRQVSPLFFPNIVRFVNDRKTWKVPLDVVGLSKSHSGHPSQLDPFVCNSWRLARALGLFSDIARDLSMVYNVRHPKTAQNTYLVAEQQLVDAMEELEDYVCESSERREDVTESIDSYIPALCASHMRFPGRYYSNKASA